jgi:hypothetical protein
MCRLWITALSTSRVDAEHPKWSQAQLLQSTSVLQAELVAEVQNNSELSQAIFVVCTARQEGYRSLVHAEWPLEPENGDEKPGGSVGSKS